MSNDKPQYNTARDILKVIAIIAMTADHASTAFLNDGTAIYGLCQFFGNFTIVIMCFFIVRGLRHTRSVLNYALRLLVWAMISEVPFYLLFGMRLNILFTLLASLLIILLIDRKGWPLGIAALMLFFPLSWICDWSIIAPVFTVIYYVLQKRHIEKLSLLLIPASYFIFRNILYYETQVEICGWDYIDISCCLAGVSYDGQSFRKQEGKNSWNSFLCILFSASHNNLDNK